MNFLPALRYLLIAFALGLTACSNPLHNENDWAFKKGASTDYIPLQVSRKHYR